MSSVSFYNLFYEISCDIWDDTGDNKIKFIKTQFKINQSQKAQIIIFIRWIVIIMINQRIEYNCGKKIASVSGKIEE